MESFRNGSRGHVVTHSHPRHLDLALGAASRNFTSPKHIRVLLFPSVLSSTPSPPPLPLPAPTAAADPRGESSRAAFAPLQPGLCRSWGQQQRWAVDGFFLLVWFAWVFSTSLGAGSVRGGPGHCYCHCPLAGLSRSRAGAVLKLLSMEGKGEGAERQETFLPALGT